MPARASAVINTTIREFGIGVPQQNLIFWHGGFYYLFWLDDTTLRAFTSPDFVTWTAQNTDGAGNVDVIENNGRSISFVYGTIGSDLFVWAVINRTSAVPPFSFNWYRWSLIDGVLGTPTVLEFAFTAKLLGNSQLAKDFGGLAVNTIYGCVQADNGATSRNALRAIDSDFTDDTSMGGFNWDAVDFPQACWVFPLVGAFAVFCNDEGEAGDPVAGPSGQAREKTRTLIGDPWGTDNQIDAVGNGNFRTQNFAVNTSRSGQCDFCQLDNGSPYFVYTNNADATGANFGLMRFKRRGTTQAGLWETVSLDPTGNGGEAWHVSLTTDGVLVYLFYVLDVSGTRSTDITMQIYNPATDSFTSPIVVATMNTGRTFNRMCSTYRAHQKIVFVWNETDGAGNYDIRVGEFIAGGGLPWTLTQGVGYGQLPGIP